MRKLLNNELGRMTTEEFRSSQKHPFVLVLDNIRSMNNTGSIFRTADAFRIEEILLCGLTSCPPHREIQKTALDATESMRWRYFEHTADAITSLQKIGYMVYALEQADNAVLLQDFIPVAGEKMAFILGNEINGVDEQLISLVDGFIEIPQFGTKHSFNVSVSAGIVLWDIFRKTILTTNN